VEQAIAFIHRSISGGEISLPVARLAQRVDVRLNGKSLYDKRTSVSLVT
jgi:hypothetical protein